MANRFTIFCINQVIVRTDTLRLLSLLNQNNVAETDLNIRTAGSGFVPDEAIAVILEMMFGDTGFPGADAYCYLVKKGEIDANQRNYLRPTGGGEQQYRKAIIGLDINGFIRYCIGASGANTASLRLRLNGYILPV